VKTYIIESWCYDYSHVAPHTVDRPLDYRELRFEAIDGNARFERYIKNGVGGYTPLMATLYEVIHHRNTNQGQRIKQRVWRHYATFSLIEPDPCAYIYDYKLERYRGVDGSAKFHADLIKRDRHLIEITSNIKQE
tara:strand:- start:1549 stop:1953 length:405 start_codon:yes stop_codon:yes gene_type:complete